VNPFLYTFDFGFTLFSGIRTTMNSNGMFLRLFKNDVTPQTYSVLTDFTAADYGGHTDKNVSFGPVLAGENGTPTSFQQVQFDSTPNGTDNVCYGALLADTINGYIAGVRFQSPINMGELHQRIPMLLKLTPDEVSMEVES
jgi:hypothetical protein